MYVYILKCSDDIYYTGVTNNLEKRLQEHQQRIDRNSYIHLLEGLYRLFITKCLIIQ
jgi:putative endonuclease